VTGLLVERPVEREQPELEQRSFERTHEMIMVKRRAGLLMVTALALGVGVTGCGGSSGTAAKATTSADTSDPLVKYSQCMRSNGEPSFPDPVGGRLQLRVTKGGALDPSSSQFLAAQKACQSLEPAGLKNSGQNPQQQDQMLKYVACMRKNGVPKFPDPQSDGRILIDPSSGVDPQSSQFKAAETTCRTLMPGGVAPGGS
jgi:hypothetical protein